MNRRKFLKGALAAPFFPTKELIYWAEKAVIAPTPLAFSSTAFDHSGLSMRFVRQFDPNESRWLSRMDVLHGFGSVR